MLSFNNSSHGDTVIVRVLVVFGEAEPLQGLVCRSCKAARLCAASQDRQTDRQGIGDVFTICSGRTVVMGDDEEERHFHGVRRQSRGASEDLLPDITHYLSQRPVKHWCACCGTLSALTWKTGQGLTMMLSFFFKYNRKYRTVDFILRYFCTVFDTITSLAGSIVFMFFKVFCDI